METPVKLPTRLAALLLPIMAAGVISPPASAQRPGRFEQAELFLELNDTDGDLGLHAAIDGETWTQLSIKAPDDRTMLQVVTRGRLRVALTSS